MTNHDKPSHQRTAAFPVLGLGWDFPLRREGSPAQFAAAADEAAVRRGILLVLGTARGERVMRPDFGSGLHRLVFAPNNGATQATAAFEVREALLRHEPRIEVLDVTVAAGGDRGEALLIDIDYRVRSTDNRFNLVYPFYLDRSRA